MLSSKPIYDSGIDFVELALQDAEFAKVLKPNKQLDFSDPVAVFQLTRALLRRDFKLHIELPPDRLCPPVPNRLNYVTWIQNLIDSTNSTYLDRNDPNRDIICLDIGTGASCIYPLLGCAQRSNWKFIGTEADDKSFEFARKNVTLNNLEHRIKLLKTKTDDPLLPLDKIQVESISATFLNPPFYSSTSELLLSAQSKSRAPYSSCTGSASEMVFPTGGETGFVRRLISESAAPGARHRVQWFSSLLGKLGSVEVVVDALRQQQVGVGNWAVTELATATGRTRRWAVAWSFGPRRPAGAVARGVGAGSGVERKWLPPAPEVDFVLHGTNSRNVAANRLNEIMEDMPLQWQWRQSIYTGVGFSDTNVWSRASRRMALRKTGHEGDDDAMYDDDDNDNDGETSREPKFGFKISLMCTQEGKDTGLQGVRVLIRWLKGHDAVLFESFCGMLRRKLST